MLLEKHITKEISIAVIRIITGILIASHGIYFFDPDAITNLAGMLNDLNFPIPRFMAYLAKGAEFFGGILFAIGFLTRLVSIPLSITMLVLIWMANWNIFNQDLPTLYILLFALYCLHGAGKYSVDHYLKQKAAGKEKS